MISSFPREYFKHLSTIYEENIKKVSRQPLITTALRIHFGGELFGLSFQKISSRFIPRVRESQSIPVTGAIKGSVSLTQSISQKMPRPITKQRPKTFFLKPGSYLKSSSNSSLNFLIKTP